MKKYSEEIEYSEENIEAFADAAYDLECFSFKNLFEIEYAKNDYMYILPNKICWNFLDEFSNRIKIISKIIVII